MSAVEQITADAVALANESADETTTETKQPSRRTGLYLVFWIIVVELCWFACLGWATLHFLNYIPWPWQL